LKSYGTVNASEGNATISVVLEEDGDEAIHAFRRQFSCVKDESSPTLSIDASPGNCVQLDSFVKQYPLEGRGLDWIHSIAEARRQRAKDFQLFLDHEMPVGRFHMLLPPREYQELAASIFVHNKMLLLGDTVGLGKTVTAITALSNPNLHPVVYVTQTHLPHQVQESFRRFAPKLQTVIVKSRKQYDLTFVRGLGGRPFPDVILIPYSRLSGWGPYLSSIVKTVVWDEVQELRRPSSARYRAAKLIADAAEYRLGMSATPIYNYCGEIFYVMDAIAPGELGSWDDFCLRWCNGDKIKPLLLNPKLFGQHLRKSGLFLRRTREDVGRELPPCSYVLQPVSSDHKELEKVSESCTELAKALLYSSGSGFDKLRASQDFNKKLRLATGLAKAPFVAEFVRMLVESGEKVVLFGWHRAVYDVWMAKFVGLPFSMYTGKESIAQKESAKKDFISGKVKLLVLSLRSGVGLDGLQDSCNLCVMGELDWSPGVQEQAIGRVWRDGQTKPVTVYYMLSEEGSDPYMVEVLDLKTLQSTGICDPQRNIDDCLLQNLEIDPNRIKELARRYLEANVNQLDESDPIRNIIRTPVATRKSAAFGFRELSIRDPLEIERVRAYYAEESMEARTRDNN
jgi:superfamily II DNA or RNA helicase